MRFFVLDGSGEPQPENDLEVWSRWFEAADRSVARTAVRTDVFVLTTFAGALEDEEDKLFETRVFGGALDGEEIRSDGRRQAEEAHRALVSWCLAGSVPDAGLSEEQLG